MQTVEAVKLPEQYMDKPYLGEFYGTVEWTVRAIYCGYFGWFDGNPTNLEKLSNSAFDAKLLDMIGVDNVLEEIHKSLDSGEYQMALQLCNLLLNASAMTEEAKALKADGLLGMAKHATSANARHYYISCAKE